MGTAGREPLFERGGVSAATALVVQNHRDNDDDDNTERQQCRICASDVDADYGIDIFAEDSRRKYLQTKIRKYLYILVSTEDKLSKMVCSTCAKRLEGVHRFATMAYRTQERLRLRFDDDRRSARMEIAGEISPNNEDEEKREDFLENFERQHQKDRGLLHSILTKGGIEIVTEKEAVLSTLPETRSGLLYDESEANRDESQSSGSMNTEEMEVRVDPMIFLECDLEEGLSDYSDELDEEKCKKGGEYLSEKINALGETRSSMEHRDVERVTRRSKDSSEEKKVIESDEDIVGNSATTKPYECTICARTFVSQMGLENHLWSHLPRERRYNEISKPNLRSSQNGYAINGLLHTHTTDNNSIAAGNFVCPICSKRISTKGNLKVHLETHRPKGKYGCDICGRIFKTQSNLFRHKEYHGGIQFPCNVCGRVYPTNSTLRAHSITHSDLRPHACPLCDKTFKRNQDLKFHINQHTGARPYQCPYCPKAFASSGNCFSHRKRMHPREVHRDRQRAADLMR